MKFTQDMLKFKVGDTILATEAFCDAFIFITRATDGVGVVTEIDLTVDRDGCILDQPYLVRFDDSDLWLWEYEIAKTITQRKKR